MSASHTPMSMAFIVVADSDPVMQNIEPGNLGTNGVDFYVRESEWSRIKEQLLKVARKA